MLLKSEGFNELEKMLDDIGTLERGKISDEALSAGKQEVRKVWLEEIERRKLDQDDLNYDRTHQMKKNVKTTKNKENKYGKFATIYPFAEEERKRRGKMVKMRNAEKAYLLHYGWDDNLPQHVAANGGTPKHYEGSRWVDDVEKIGSERAYKVMDEIITNYIQSKG